MPQDNSPFEATDHRPWPHPASPWRLRQRWSRLLFAHWPMPAAAIQSKLPAGLCVDTFDGWAWLGVVPFVMDRVRFRTLGQSSVSVPTATAFPELNLRTYVVGPDGRPGVYFFSLDAGSLLAVVGARIGFGLPYFWARMTERSDDDTIHYTSRRLLGGKHANGNFDGSFRSLGRPAAMDDLQHFLTARYALYVRRFGSVQVGEIHHRPWQLQQADAEFRTNTLATSFGFTLPNRPPLLHYSQEIEMEAWTLHRVRQAQAAPVRRA
ncbi:MAG: YqjF family protein [Janthinobacterium lividum]